MRTPASVTPKIVDVVATREGVDPLELEVPLNTAVDAEALDALVTGAGGRDERNSVRVTFTYLGYEITVDGPNRVGIAELPVDGEADATTPPSSRTD